MCYKRYERIVKWISYGEVGLYEDALKLARKEGIGPEGIESAMQQGSARNTAKRYLINRLGLQAHLNVHLDEESKPTNSYFCH